MEVLTVGTLKKILKDMPDDLVIYLGDDEELNGIHEAYFAQEISKDEAEGFSHGSYEINGFMIS